MPFIEISDSLFIAIYSRLGFSRNYLENWILLKNHRFLTQMACILANEWQIGFRMTNYPDRTHIFCLLTSHAELNYVLFQRNKVRIGMVHLSDWPD